MYKIVTVKIHLPNAVVRCAEMLAEDFYGEDNENTSEGRINALERFLGDSEGPTGEKVTADGTYAYFNPDLVTHVEVQTSTSVFPPLDPFRERTF